MNTKLFILLLFFACSCGIEIKNETASGTITDRVDDDLDLANLAFGLFRNDLDQDLFILELNFENTSVLSLAQNDVTWKRQMAETGHLINRLGNSLDFSKQNKEFLSDILQGLRENNILPKNKDIDLFDRFISPHISVNGNGAPKIDEKHFIRRNYLSIIAATQWHLQAIRLQEYPELMGVRGGTTLHDNFFVPRLYAKYLAFENNIKIDFSKDIKEIYRNLSDNLSDSKKFNIFGYSRQNASSHLRQKDLKNVSRYGIDMRFLKKGNAVPILPNEGRHLHFGFFQFEGSEKGTTFFKEEAHGFGSASDKVAHLKNWGTHIATKKAGKGPRETSTPKMRIEDLTTELKNAGYTNDKLLKKLMKVNSKKQSLNLVLQEILKDIATHPEYETYQSKINQKFDVIEVIGNEYVLTDEKTKKTVTSDIFIDPISPKTKIDPASKFPKRVAPPASRKIKLPKSIRFKW